MAIDIGAAERFILTNARLVERHRFAVMVRDAPASLVVRALRAYQNPDGGFGHALEPDVRGPESQPLATLTAIDILAEIDELGDPMVAEATQWLSSVSEPDGGVPLALPTVARSPHAPFVTSQPGSSFLTFTLVGVLGAVGVDHPWLEAASDWCWTTVEAVGAQGGHAMMHALGFSRRRQRPPQGHGRDRTAQTACAR